ncbi:MAG: hypothetical protein AAF125_27495 [Chloroflexota bacterium]
MAEETTTENTSAEERNFSEVWDEFLEHNRRAFEEGGKAVDALLPEGFKEHSAVARDELRKGFKLLVDYTIDELEKVTKMDPPASKGDDDGDDSPPKSTTGKTKVKVQVE